MGNSSSVQLDSIADAVLTAEASSDASLSSLIISPSNVAESLRKDGDDAKSAVDDILPVDRAALLSKRSEFTHLLLAGIRESGGSKPNTIKRVLEEVASGLPNTPNAVKDVQSRLGILNIVHALCKRERRDAEQPYVRPRVIASALEEDEDKVKNLVLMSLNSLLDSARFALAAHAVHEPIAKNIVNGLTELFEEFAPASLFEDWSPARIGPEKQLPTTRVDARRVYANAGQNPSAAVSGVGAWKVDKSPAGDVIWGISFAEPQPISSIRLEWDGLAPKHVQVEATADPIPNPLRHATRVAASIPGVVSHDDILLTANETATQAASAAQSIICSTPRDNGTSSMSTVQVPSSVLPEGAVRAVKESGEEVVGAVTWRAVAAKQLEETDAARLHIPVSACPGSVGDQVLITGLRIFLRGCHASNSKKAPALTKVTFFEADTETHWLSPLSILRDLQGFLEDVVQSKELSDATRMAAQTISLKIALASGSQACLLRACRSFLISDEKLWWNPVPFELVAPVSSAITVIKEQRSAAVRKYLTSTMGPAKLAAGEVELRFDPTECQTTSNETSGLTLSNDNKTIYTTTSTNSLCICDRGFSAGKTVWVFRLDEDNANSECTCFGAATKPISDRNYNSSQVLMYRAYNGQLYGSGSVGETKEKVHPNDLVTIEWNADEGTLSYKVNDKDQGVCFKGLQGKELFPAVAFYSSNRKVSIMKCETLGQAGLTAAPDQETMVKAAVDAMDAGGDASLVLVSQNSADDASTAISLPPKPSRPVLQDEDDESLQKELHAGVQMLIELGFNWVQAAAALRATSDNMDQAAERLFGGEFPAEMIDEVENRRIAFNRKLEQYELDISKWEAEKEAKEKAASEKLAQQSAKTRPKQAAANKMFRTTSPINLLQTAGAFLTYAADLAGAFTPGLSLNPSAAGAGSGALQPSALPPVQSQLHAISLEEPFALQADATTFVELSVLLRRVVDAYRSTTDAKQQQCQEIAILLLRLVRANLSRLVQAHVHPNDAGIITTGAKATLAPLHDILESLMVDKDIAPPIQQEAVRTVDTGLPVLYASAQQRADLLHSLIEQHEGLAADASSPQAELLARCLRQFSSPAGVVSLLPPLSRTLKGVSAADQDAQVNEIVALLSQLFDVLDRETRARVDRADSSDPASLLEQGANLLAAFQRHLLSLVMEEVDSAETEQYAGKLPVHAVHTPTDQANYSLNAVELVEVDQALLDVKLAGSSWSIRGDLAGLPTSRVLMAYARMLGGACSSLLKTLRPKLEAASAASINDIEAVLRTSAIGKLLPAFFAGLIALGSQPWICTHMLPIIADLIPGITQVSDLLVKASVRVDSLIQRKVIEQLKSQGDWWRVGGPSAPDGVVCRLVDAQAMLGSNSKLSAYPPVLESGSHFSDTTSKPSMAHTLWLGQIGIEGEHCQAAFWLATTGKEKATTDVAGGGHVVLSARLLAHFLSGSSSSEALNALKRSTLSFVAPLDVTGTHTGGGKEANYRVTLSLPVVDASESNTGHIISGSMPVEIFLSGVLKDASFVGRCGAHEIAVTTSAAALKPTVKGSKVTAPIADASVGTAVLRRQPLSGKEAITAAAAWYTESREGRWNGVSGFCGVQSGLYNQHSIAHRVHAHAVERHWLGCITMLITAASGRFISTMARGPMISFEEDEVGPLLRTTLFSQGRVVSATAPLSRQVFEATGLQLQWSGGAPAEVASAEDELHYMQNFLSDVESKKSPEGEALIAWLQKHHPEAPVRRKQGVFPEVELPLFLALVKHTNLTKHLKETLSKLKDDADGTPLSTQLSAVWREVLFVRSFLRKERTSYRDGQRSVAEPLGATILEGDQQLQRKLKVSTPSTFDALKDAMRARALFLLELHGCTDELGVTGEDKHLAGASLVRILSTGVGVAPSLVTRTSLERTVSRDAAALHSMQDKWSAGTAGLEQLMLRHSTSFESRVADTKDDDSGAAALPSGRPKLGRQVSWKVIEEEEGESEMTAAIEDMTAEVISDTNAHSKFDVVAKTIKAYIKYGTGGPPPLVQRLLLWRDVRSLARAYAMQALTSLIETTRSASYASSLLFCLLQPFRSALAGQKEQYLQVAAKSSEKLTGESWIERHALGSDLDGASEVAKMAVIVSHRDFTRALEQLYELGLQRRDVTLTSIVCWCFTVDVLPESQEFSLLSAVVEKLSSKLRLTDPEWSSAEVADDGTVDQWGPGYVWHPWNLVDLRQKLFSGRVSKRAVFQHMLAAPGHVVQGLHPDLDVDSAEQWLMMNDVDVLTASDDAKLDLIDSIADSMSMDALIALYARFTLPDTAWNSSQGQSLPLGHRFLHVPTDDGDRAEDGIAYSCDRASLDAVLVENICASSQGASLSAPGASDAKSLEQKDNERRSKKPERVRGPKRHSRHPHDLTQDLDRTSSGYTCNSCSGRIAMNGSASWAHVSDDWDCCSVCFAARAGAEAWEKGPIEQLKATFSDGNGGVRMVPCPPGKNMRIFSDSEAIYKSAPSFMTSPAFRDYFWALQVPKVGGQTARSTTALTITVKAPVRVLLGIPKAMSEEAVIKIDWLREDFLPTPTTLGDERDGFRLFRSKYIFAPPECLPASFATGGLEISPTIELRGLGYQASSNYVVVLEEIPPLLLDKSDFKRAASASASKLTPRQPVPIRPLTLLRRMTWSVVKLMALHLTRAQDTEKSQEEIDDDLRTTTSDLGNKAVNRAKGKADANPIAQHTILKVCAHHLKDVAKALKLAKTSERHAVSYLEVEGTAAAVLQFLVTIADVTFIKTFLAADDSLKTLLLIFQCGTPRLQRVILQLFRIIASRIDPKDFENALRMTWPLAVVSYWENIAGMHESQGGSVAGFLFSIIGAPLAASNPYLEAEEPVDTPVLSCHPLWVGAKTSANDNVIGSGDVLLALASECIAFSRTLMTLSGWRRWMAPHLRAAVINTAAIVEPTAPSDIPIAGHAGMTIPEALRVYGAFGMLGGFVEPVRVGGQVVVAAFRLTNKITDKANTEATWGAGVNNTATVLSIRGSKAIVSYAGEITGPCADVDLVRLHPVPLLSTPTGVLPADDAVYEALKIIVDAASSTSVQNAFVPVFHSVLLALSQLLKHQSAISLALKKAMLRPLYTLALRPSNEDVFLSAPAIHAAYRSLLPRLVELSSSDACLDSATTAISQDAEAPTVSVSFDLATIEELVTKTGLHCRMVCAVLHMFLGDKSASEAFLRAHHADLLCGGHHGDYRGFVVLPPVDGVQLLVLATIIYIETEFIGWEFTIDVLRLSKPSDFAEKLLTAESVAALRLTASPAGPVSLIGTISFKEKLEEPKSRDLVTTFEDCTAQFNIDSSTVRGELKLIEIRRFDESINSQLAGVLVPVALFPGKKYPLQFSDDAIVARLDAKKPSTGAADETLLADAELIPPSATGHSGSIASKRSSNKAKVTAAWSHVGQLADAPVAYTALKPSAALLAVASPLKYRQDNYKLSGFKMVEFMIRKHTPSQKLTVGFAEPTVGMESVVGGNNSSWSLNDEGKAGHGGEWRQVTSALKDDDRVCFSLDATTSVVTVYVNDRRVHQFHNIDAKALFPAVTLHTIGDEISIIQSEPAGICFAKGQQVYKQLVLGAEETESAVIKMANKGPDAQTAVALGLLSPLRKVNQILSHAKLASAISEYSTSLAADSALKVLMEDGVTSRSTAVAMIEHLEYELAALEDSILREVVEKCGANPAKPVSLLELNRSSGSGESTTFRKIQVDPVTSFVLGSADREFILDRRHQIFTAYVGAADSGSEDGSLPAFTVEILGDGRTLWSSKGFINRHRQMVLVDVFNVRKLTLHLSAREGEPSQAVVMNPCLWGAGVQAIVQGTPIVVLATAANVPAAPDLSYPRLGSYTGQHETHDDGSCILQINYFDRETGVVERRDVPADYCHKVTAIYGTTLGSSDEANRQALAEKMVSVQCQSMVRVARFVLQQVISSYTAFVDQRDANIASESAAEAGVQQDLPPFNAAVVGGAEALLKLIKLIAFGDAALRKRTSAPSSQDANSLSIKEFLALESESTESTPGGDSEISGLPFVTSLTPWRTVLAFLLQKEKTDKALERPALRRTLSKRPSSQSADVHVQDSCSMSDLLVQDCIHNFVSAIRTDERQIQVLESCHPLPKTGSFTGQVTVPHGTQIEIVFDEESYLGTSTLAFYSTAEMKPEDLVITFGGDTEPENAYPIRNMPGTPLVLPYSRLFWKLECSPDLEDRDVEHDDLIFGYRAYVRPNSSGWTREVDVLSGDISSLAWSCWLLDFLLNRVSHILKVGAVHNQQVFDALVSYLRSWQADSITRGQVVALLCQLLQRPDMFTGELQLADLDGVEELVIRTAEKHLSTLGSNKVVGGLPVALQDLLELVIFRRSAIRAFENSKLARLSGFNEFEKYPGRGVGVTLTSKNTTTARPTQINFGEVVNEFKVQYAEVEPLWIATLGRDPVEAWAQDTNGNTSGFFLISGVEDDEERACFEIEWLLAHPEHDGIVVPEDAALDFYDFMYQTCMECAQNETHAAVGHEGRMYAERFRWLSFVRHRDLGVPVIGEGMSPASVDEPPRPPPSRVAKPWISTDASPPHGHSSTLRVVRPSTQAFAARATVIADAPLSKLQTYALPTFAPSLTLSQLHFTATGVDGPNPTSGQVVLLSDFDPSNTVHLEHLLRVCESVQTVAFVSRASESVLSRDQLRDNYLLTVSDEDFAKLSDIVARSTTKSESVAVPAESPAAASNASIALRSPLAVGRAVAKLSRNRSKASKSAWRNVGPAALSTGLASSFVALPIKAELPAQPTKLLDQLVWTNDLVMALSEGARPSDGILCHAWMEAIGENRYVETNHPYRSNEVLTGEVHIEGASGLRVYFNPRCATAPGTSLHLEYDSVIKAYSGPASRSGDSSKTAGNWPKEPVAINSSRFKYSFRAPTLSEGTGEWGFAFTVVPVWNTSARTAFLSKHTFEVEHAAAHVMSGWTSEMDAELVNMARQACDETNMRKLAGSSERFTLRTLPLVFVDMLSSSMELRHNSLLALPTQLVRMRFALIRLLNKVFSNTLSCFSLASTRPWSLGSRMKALSHCIFLEAKQGILDAALSSTNGSGGSSIELSNFKATASEARGHIDPENSECMFAQAYKALRTCSSKELRGYRDSSQNKVFEIRFEGESGIDAGGVYREGLSRMTDDLFSDRFTLLVKCGNARKGYKMNTDAYVPNSTWKTPLAMSMLEFAGRLMGLSLRTKACLPFTFPSIVWKAINNEARNFSDLTSMDAVYAEFLETVRDCDRERVSVSGVSQPVIRSDAEFIKAFPDLRFISFNCVGEEVELVAGGKSIPVTFSNRLQFVEAAIQFRLHEFDAQLAALRRGFANIVPIRSLSLFTWQEIEMLVAGKPDIDVELLKRNTSYEGFNSSHPVIESFWRVFESFSQSERQQLIRFAWGRSRLPPEGTSWTTKFKITRLSGGDKALPMGHTCFSTIDLPEYSSDEIMAWGLRTAMNWGIGGILNG